MALQQIGGHGTPIEPELDLAIDAPGRVVSQNADDRQVMAHRRIELHGVEAKGAIAGQHHHT